MPSTVSSDPNPLFHCTRITLYVKATGGVKSFDAVTRGHGDAELRTFPVSPFLRVFFLTSGEESWHARSVFATTKCPATA